MPKMQQCIELNKISKNQSFQSTCYSKTLDQELHHLANHYQSSIFNPSSIPLAAFTPNPTSIVNALMNQYYPIELDDTYWVTCNPFHHELHSGTLKKNILLTTSKIFIDHLAHQWPENPTEGLWKIVHYYGFINKSTDIHICSNAGILFKKNGHLQSHLPIQKKSMESLMYFIKLHSHMDPAIFRTPQDGAYYFNRENIKIDIRTSTLPTQEGEMISLRLFHYDQSFQSLDNIGFSLKKLTKIRSLLKIPNGLILITGATGSGKSTTLYAMLRELTHRHVITLEDPIERLISGIHQTSINEWQNYTMSVGLKALLRHNPDVIAIGEIRDNQTAEAVINAAYSGHLVIASLHTNSIETTLLRLANLGISPFMIGYCLRAIISQSLHFIEGKTNLKSELLICETPYIIHNLKKELNDFINNNSYMT